MPHLSSTPQSPPLLAIQAVGKDYTATVLDGVNVELFAGEVLALTGENGAGKSTLSKILCGLEQPTRGGMVLGGQTYTPTSRRDAERQGVRMVMQELGLVPTLTVAENLLMGRLPHRAGFAAASPRDAEVINAAITRLDLTRFADHAFSTLSGGEKQRVMVARALAQEPRVLILDEPTNHLDIRHQLELLALLRGLGLTVICTLHDLTLAAQFADRVLVLSQGRVLSDGPPDLALSEPHIATAFNVTARVDRSGPAPRFSFHL